MGEHSQGRPGGSAEKQRHKRAALAARLLLATFGGYAIVSLWTAVIARLLPVARVDAVTIATMTAFLLWIGFFIAAFAPVSISRLWTWSALFSGLLALLLFIPAPVVN